MTAGQEKFLGFILDRVKDEKKDETRALLEESFAKQSDGSFNAAYLVSFTQKIAPMLKPEFTGEVKKIIEDFGKNIPGGAIQGALGGLSETKNIAGALSSLLSKYL